MSAGLQVTNVYSKFKNEEVTDTEQVYDEEECNINNEQRLNSYLNPHECAMHNDYELYIVSI